MSQHRMERYFAKRKQPEDVTQMPTQESANMHLLPENSHTICSPEDTKLDHEIELLTDPAMRKKMYEFEAKEKDRVRRYYLQKGPCQPNIIFPKRKFGNEERKFIFNWFKEHPTWLEYSISSDSAYCLFCYLFKPARGGQSGGEVFVSEGFTNWRQGMKRLKEHVGDHNSLHNKCRKAAQDLMNQKPPLLVTYVERDVFLTVKTEDIIQRFQNMKSRRGVLDL